MSSGGKKSASLERGGQGAGRTRAEGSIHRGPRRPHKELGSYSRPKAQSLLHDAMTACLLLVIQRAFCIEGAPQLLCSSIPLGVSAWRGSLGRGPHVPVLGPSSPQAVAMLRMWGGILLLKVWAKSAEGVLYVCISRRVCLLLTSVGAPEGPQGALRDAFCRGP